jgi:hypothetical protein
MSEPRTIANYATVALIGNLNAIREEIGDSRKTTELIRLARLAADLLAARDAEVVRLAGCLRRAHAMLATLQPRFNNGELDKMMTRLDKEVRVYFPNPTEPQ